jgi:hypothetical protein
MEEGGGRGEGGGDFLPTRTTDPIIVAMSKLCSYFFILLLDPISISQARVTR